MQRLRVLCLHGYHGSAETLRRQLSPLAGSLDAVADFVCVDAPALAVGDFGWWHATEDAGGVHYRGLTRSREALAAYGSFDGVLGFSQGAALAALLVAVPTTLRFAIIIGGFAIRDPRHAAVFEAAGAISVRSLHVIGRLDAIVAPQASHFLASRFRAPTIAEHDGGHVIAATDAVRGAALAFLQDVSHRTSNTA
jgi:dienelactone hydrolase